MMNEIPVLQTKLKKYERKSKKKSADGKEHVTRRYMIPIKKDQIEGSKFENVEDIVILSNDDFNYEIKRSKNAASLIKELELSLKDRDKDIQLIHETKNKLKKIESEFAVIRENYANALKELELKNREIMKINYVIRGEDHISNTPKQIVLLGIGSFVIVPKLCFG